MYPELNFTLPTMLVDPSTMPQVRRHYREIITGAMQRAVELEAPGVVIEFETLPDSEVAFTQAMLGVLDTTRFVPADYDLG